MFPFGAFHISGEALGVVRILYSLYFLLVLGVPNFLWVGQNPDYFFSPPKISPGILFSGFPSDTLLGILTFCIYLLLVFLLFGWRTRVVSVLLALFFFLGYTFAYSFGKIDHTVMLIVMPLFLSFAGWGEAYSIDSLNSQKSPETLAWPVGTLLLMLCFGFFTSGVLKLAGGWLDLSTQAVRSHLVLNYHGLGRQTVLGETLLSIYDIGLWEAMDYLTVVIEIAFLAAFLNHTVLRYFVAVAVVFHLFNLLAFGIPFMGNFPVYLLAVRWGGVLDILKKIRCDALLQHLMTWRYFLASVILLACYSGYILAISSIRSSETVPSFLALALGIAGYEKMGIEVMLIHVVALIGVFFYIGTIVCRRVKAGTEV